MDDSHVVQLLECACDLGNDAGHLCLRESNAAIHESVKELQLKQRRLFAK